MAVSMRIGVEEIRNALLNHNRATVAAYIDKNADNVHGSLSILNRCIAVMDEHAEDLKNGAEFMTLFVNYQVAKQHHGSRGLGDTIAKMTSAVGIKPCGGCKQRQEWLNKKIPYRSKR